MNEIAERYGMSAVANVLARESLPAIAFSLEAARTTRSRFGGTPLLPLGFLWPSHIPRVIQFPPAVLERLGIRQPEQPSAPQPLDFLLQIDLAELRDSASALALPASGL